MSQPYTLAPDLANEVEIPERGTHSRTLYEDPRKKVVLFGFAAGEELSEHTSSRAASIHILSGRITLGLGDDRHQVGPGAWVHMPPRLPHSVLAETEATMLLTLFEPPAAE